MAPGAKLGPFLGTQTAPGAAGLRISVIVITQIAPS